MRTKRYKFQALITSCSADAEPRRLASKAGTSLLPPGQVRRIVVKGQHRRTHVPHFFSALVANNGDGSDWLDGGRAIVTIVVADDKPGEYLAVGDHFALWLGHNIADGVITRRLFI